MGEYSGLFPSSRGRRDLGLKDNVCHLHVPKLLRRVFPTPRDVDTTGQRRAATRDQAAQCHEDSLKIVT